MHVFPPDGPMPADGPKVVPAATVVIFRKAGDGAAPEVLMVQRARELRFAGGAAVFPGGRIDPEDHELAARIMPGLDPEVSAAKIAGIRETLEETGLAIAVDRPVSGQEAAAARTMLEQEGALAPVLERFGWKLRPDQLTLFAHWCPPRDKAFDTRFFVTDLGTGAVDIRVDATENTRLFWASAEAALRMADAGEISVIFPTRCNLARLAQYRSHEDAVADIARHPVRRLHASQEVIDGEPWLMVPEGHGYPVRGQRLSDALRG